MADPGFDGHPRAPLRRRRPQKWDGSGGQDGQALGRSRGGFGTKVHGAVTGLGSPAELILTAGQASDMSQASPPIEGVPVEVVSADKGYDNQAVVEVIESRGAEAVIPSLKSRAEQRGYDRGRYKDRSLAKPFWHEAKQYRRVATRYEKTARNFRTICFRIEITIFEKF